MTHTKKDIPMRTLPLAAALCAALAAAPTWAQSSDSAVVHRSGIVAGVHAGVGFNDFWRLGVALRGGLRTADKFYLGGAFRYNFGSSLTAPSPVPGSQTQSISKSSFALTAEAGYDIVAESSYIIRPIVGAGIFSASTESSVGASSASSSATEFILTPGVQVFTPLFANIDVGAEARYNIVSGADAFSLTGFITFTF